MNPRLRVALTLLPLLSLGLLSWLPFLYLLVAHVPGPLHRRNLAMTGATTVITLATWVTTQPHGAVRMLLVSLWCWLILVAMASAWVCTSPRSLALVTDDAPA